MFQLAAIGWLRLNPFVNQGVTRFSGSFFLLTTQMPLQGKTSGRQTDAALSNCSTDGRGWGILLQRGSPSTSTSVAHSAVSSWTPSSTVRFIWFHRSANSCTIRYASITTNTWPRVWLAKRTFTGRISKWTVLLVRNAHSTWARSL